MQIKRVLELREAWGGKACEHSEPLVKEYDLGAATGDYVCPVCGESGFGSNWVKEQRKAKDDPMS